MISFLKHFIALEMQKNVNSLLDSSSSSRN